MDASSRYHRQMLLPGIGEAGQRRLRDAHALIVGCGALGSVIIDTLARAGVGTLTIVDRDVVEITNLQRQVLYDERDVKAGTPKAIAAKLRIAQINSEITVHAHVDDFNHRNFEKFLAADRSTSQAQSALSASPAPPASSAPSSTRRERNIDIILDGLDNFETRYLLNDIAVSRKLPYIYGGAVGTTGVSFAILPYSNAENKNQKTESHQAFVHWSDEQSTPCLRCVFPEAPPPGTTPTCDTAGVLGPAVMMIVAHQATQAIKLLTNNIAKLDRSLLSIDLWSNEARRFDVSNARQPGCPCCGQRNFEFIEGGATGSALSLCGRNAVQINPAAQNSSPIDLREIAARLAPHGRFTHNDFLLRGEFAREKNSRGESIELTLFPNGRAIIKGVNEPESARSIYAKYIGA